MANPILPQSPQPSGVRNALRKWGVEGLAPWPAGDAGPGPQSEPESPDQGERDYAVAKVKNTYFVCGSGQPGVAYRVTKPAGRIVCDCPDFRQIPQRPCQHIRAVIRHVRGSQGARPPVGLEGLPEITKSRTAWQLEYPFRPDQIKTRDGLEYIDGAAVLQRLNDVLGTASWSFRILGQPVDLHGEVLIRGRLTALFDGQTVIKEDFGAHEYVRHEATGAVLFLGDALKSAVTDCIKRCAHQLGVGLHLYSRDGKYRSFRVGGIVQ